MSLPLMATSRPRIIGYQVGLVARPWRLLEGVALVGLH
jgi:hypothetical protein